MAHRERTTSDQENELNAAQVLFTANPLFLTPQLKQLMQTPERFFDELEAFSSAWFKRRQEATHAMIDAGRRLASNGSGDPASALTEISHWQTRSMEHLAEDAKDCTEMLSRCAGILVKNEVKAMEDISETVQKAAKSSKSEPV